MGSSWLKAARQPLVEFKIQNKDQLFEPKRRRSGRLAQANRPIGRSDWPLLAHRSALASRAKTGFFCGRERGAARALT
jgi:hypothetical protein